LTGRRARGFVARQAFHFVIFGEKSSLEDVVKPIAEQFEADLYLPTGEISDTLVYQIAKDAAADGRPLVMFTLSDCDPAGHQMPVSIGRKLQASADLIAGRDGMPDRTMIKRWRAATSDKRFERSLIEAQEKCRLICERGKGPVRPNAYTGENEWFTELKYLERARSALGEIDLDPASCEEAQRSVRATRYFTKADDGLAHEWHGRVYLNPPFAQPLIYQFVDKMVEERLAGRVSAAIMLTHNYTDTRWFRTALSVADAIGFTSGRVRFYTPDGEVADPFQGQAFFYFGNETARFAEAFKDVCTGVVYPRLLPLDQLSADELDDLIARAKQRLERGGNA
jgi:hypothetical protein